MAHSFSTRAQNHTNHQDMGHLHIGKEYWTWRDILVKTELVVLRILNFDLHVELPFQYLPEIIDDICAESVWGRVDIESVQCEATYFFS